MDDVAEGSDESVLSWMIIGSLDDEVGFSSADDGVASFIWTGMNSSVGGPTTADRIIFLAGTTGKFGATKEQGGIQFVETCPNCR